MDNNNVRVRFAPSPTGHLHIGSLRAALFNWLFARHNKGTFLLRIEDTDLERSKDEYTQEILQALEWTGITSDEPPVIQSKNLSLHQKVIQQLIEQGKAYRCFCSIEHVEQLKEEQLAQGKLLKYDGTCRNKKITSDYASKPSVIRFRLPFEKGPIVFNDLIHGPISFDIEQLEDFIIARSDGTPMYNFVVVVDDAMMKITHVIRGQDHISNTPKQILLYQACGYTIPYFAHIPLILGPSGDKLSKRDGAVAVLDYRKNGYLPQALCNYLVRLGWSHGDQEIFTQEELIHYFTLEGVGAKGSIFDVAKLDWVNGVYLRASDAATLLTIITTDIDPTFVSRVSSFSQEQLRACVDLYKERAKNIKDIVDNILQLHDVHYDPQALTTVSSEQLSYIQRFIQHLTTTQDFSSDNLSLLAKKICGELNIKLAVLAQPIRLALTGKIESPGVFHLLALLNKEESIRRLTNFVRVVEISKKT